MIVHAEIDISAPIGKVFSVFTDLTKIEEHINGIQSITVLEGSAQMEVGTKWKESRIMFGKEATEVMWVTALTPTKNYIVEAESNGMKYRSEYVFTEKSNGTRVQMTFTGEPQTFASKLFNIIFFFMAGVTKKALYQDMVDLQKVCEA